MKPEKRNEHKDKLLCEVDKKIKEVEDRKSMLQTSHEKALVAADDELGELKLQKEALEGLK